MRDNLRLAQYLAALPDEPQRVRELLEASRSPIWRGKFSVLKDAPTGVLYRLTDAESIGAP